MTEDRINEMVDRFLTWELPDDFNPDAGITFDPPRIKALWPVGTNLLTADQAREMVMHMLGDGWPEDELSA